MVTINKNKEIYAALTNLAQHNINITMRHIANTLQIKPENESPESYQRRVLGILASDSKDPVDVQMKAVNLLERHFPFLKPMEDALLNEKAPVGVKQYVKDFITNQQQAYKYILENMFIILGFYRNCTTHYDPEETADDIKENDLKEKTVVKGLESVFKASLRTVQQRFTYDDTDMAFIKNKNMDKPNAPYKLDMAHKFDHKDNIFSEKGLILLISLFLEKKYVSELLSKTKAFYTADDMKRPKRQSIIFETLAVYRIKLPKVRLQSEANDISLGLDMTNELRRCPKELFDLLSAADQKSFRVQDSDNADPDNPDSLLMLRSGDRFPVLALKYIDTMKLFPSIRFQTALGNYRFAFYDMHCIDGSTPHVRSLQKTLNGFGRLNDIEAERQTKWATLIRDFDDVKPDTAVSVPYITDHHASYVINNNKVAMYWDSDAKSAYLPALPNDPQATNLRQRKQQGENIVELLQPKCFMSTHELAPLVFYMMLCHKHGETYKKLRLPDAEAIIKNFVNGCRTFVEKVVNGDITLLTAREEARKAGIDYDKHLPDKLKQYLEGDSDNNGTAVQELLKNRLDKVIAETETRLERFKRDKEAVKEKANHRGKRKFVEIKAGRLGAWLAKDFVAIQPKEAKKLTGLNFRVLQSTLSVYESFDAVKRILLSAQLLGSETPHPFIKNVMNKEPKTVAAFYQTYLEEKLSWLRSIKGTNLLQWHFLKRGENKWAKRDNDYYRRLLNIYLSHPVELPRTLFADAIKRLLASVFGADFVKGSTRDDANVAFLIAKYLKQQGDDSQVFYTQAGGKYRRLYNYFKLIRGEEAKPMTVNEIDSFLKGNVEGDDDGFDYKKAIDDISKRVAKAKAKNPQLNVEQRVISIVRNDVPEYRKLSNEQKERLTTKYLGKPLQLTQKAFLAQPPNGEREEKEQRLKKALTFLKNNERTIRQYRTQDIVLFLMAKSVLFEQAEQQLNKKITEFKLKNITPIAAGNAAPLEIKVPFSIVLYIKHSKRPIIIKKKELKLKNYGDFIRFINDERIATLIPYLDNDPNKAVTIQLDDLQNEFQKYDEQRYGVFKSVHLLEKLILARKPELRDKTFTKKDKNNNDMEIPLRNNFGRLIGESDVIQDDERKEIVNTRNGFSHNSYAKEVIINTKDLGKVATAIGNKLETRIKIIKEKQ